MIDALVTGAGGFIGQALVRHIEEKVQATVLGLSHSVGDITEAATWDKLPKARMVYHLAGRSYVPDSWKDGSGFFITNAVGTQRALDYCVKHGATFILASAYVYGVPERIPVRESDPIRPSNPYALSKAIAEQLCAFASEAHGLTTVALRPFNVFGLGQKATFLIPSIIDQVLRSQPVRVRSLSPRRDYVYLEDVIDALVRAGRIEDGFHAVNVGSGVSYSVAEVIAAVQQAAGTNLPVISAEETRLHEIPDALADISLARTLLGWRPKWRFEDAISDLVDRSRQ